MKKIDGKKIAGKKLLNVKKTVESLNFEPALGVVLVGDNPASHLYVKLKEKAAKELGIELRKYTFADNVSQSDIEQTIDFLNTDKDTNGIIVQLPLPKHLDTNKIIGLIAPDKDVDGFCAINQEKFLNNEGGVYPVFPRAIMDLVESEIKDLKDKNVVIIGKSDVFDKVMSHAFSMLGANVKFIECREGGKFQTNEQISINEADVIVTACGKQKMLSCDLVRDGAVVIDGGITKDGDKTVGDVDLSECDDRDITISPVPGGVGPVTISCLLENVVKSAREQNKNNEQS